MSGPDLTSELCRHNLVSPNETNTNDGVCLDSGQPANNITVDANCLAEILRVITESHLVKTAPLVAFMITLMLAGTLGNLLVILIYQRKAVKTTANVYMLILAWLDLWSCVVLHPYVILKLVHPFDQRWTIVCKLFEFLIHTTFCCSICILTVTAVDRYLAVCKALAFIRSQRISYIMAAIGLMVGTIGSFPTIEFYGERSVVVVHKSSGVSLTCVRCDYSDTYTKSDKVFWYGAAELIMFLICLGVISVAYVCVAVRLNRRKVVGVAETDPSVAVRNTSGISRFTDTEQRLAMWAFGVWRSKAMTKQNFTPSDGGRGCGLAAAKRMTILQQHPLRIHQKSTSVESGIGPGPNGSSRRITHDPAKKKPRESVRIALMLFSVTVVFLLTWLPLFVLKFVDSSASENHFQSPIRNYLLHTYYLNNVLNPIIYLLFQRQFRREISSLCQKCSFKL